MTKNLIDFLNKQGLKIEQSDLDSPKSEIISELYAALYERLGIFKKDSLLIEYDALERIFSQTETTTQTVRLLKIFAKSSKFVKNVLQIADYNSGDVLHPVAKRTKNILNKIMRFYNAKQNEKEFASQLIEIEINTENKKKEEMNLLSDNKEKFLKLKADKANQNNLTETAKDEIKNINHEILKYQNDKIQINQQLNDSIKNLDDSINKIKLNDSLYKNLIDNVQNLNSKIVHSPQKVKDILNQAIKQRDSYNNSINEYSKNILIIKEMLNNFEQIEKRLERYYRNLEEFNNNNNEVNSQKKKIYELAQINDNKKRELSDAVNKLNIITNKIQSYNKYIDDTNQERYQEQCSRKEEIDKLKNEYIKREQRNNEEELKKNELLKLIENTKNEINENEEYIKTFEEISAKTMIQMTQHSDEYLNYIKDISSNLHF